MIDRYPSSAPDDESFIGRINKLLIYVALACVIALAIWPAWLRGGTPPALQWPFVPLGSALLALCALLPVSMASRQSALSIWLRDPFFYAGLFLLVLLGLQWRYAGRILFLNPVDRLWTYSPPLRPGWPFAFTRPESAEMLRWFFPAWAIGLVLRSHVFERRIIVKLFRFLAINAALIALLGMLQQGMGIPLFPFTAELHYVRLRFFASFGYENHAAAFFALFTAVSLGLLVHAIMNVRRDKQRRISRLVLSVMALMLNFTAMQMSLSRAGILLGWLLLAISSSWLAVMAWQRLSPAKRLNAIIGGGAAILMLAMLVYGFGYKTIGAELSTIRQGDAGSVAGQLVQTSTGDRIQLASAAWQIWQAHPWFGVGGWGFRYLLPYTATEDGWQWTQHYGKANVHNDPLQFLVEFGLVGAALLVMGFISLVTPVVGRHHGRWQRLSTKPLLFFPLLGCALVLLHSLIDLPFRSPAILFSVVITLAGTGALAMDVNPDGRALILRRVPCEPRSRCGSRRRVQAIKSNCMT